MEETGKGLRSMALHGFLIVTKAITASTFFIYLGLRYQPLRQYHGSEQHQPTACPPEHITLSWS